MQNSILAILSGNEQSTRVADALKLAGFSTDEISIMLPDEFGAQELAFGRRSLAAEAGIIGAMSGGILGAGLALVAMKLHLTSAIFDQVIAAGPVVGALAMAAALAIILGLACALFGLTHSEYVVRKYDRKTRLRNSLMAIHADNAKELKIAERILRNEGAQEVSKAEEETDRHKKVQLAR